MDVHAFLMELRRRRVFRALAWYAASAWLLIQAASILVPHLGLPPGTLRWLVALVLVGLPVVGLLAWAFDLQRTDTPAATEPARRGPLASYWVALAAGVLLGVSAWQAWHAATAPAPVEPVVTAVLPFENLSGRAEDVGLVNGLHATVIQALGTNPNLTVIGRTSITRATQEQSGSAAIAQALGARYLLEGGALREGARLLLQLRLTDTRDGSQPWYGSYERPLSGTFAVQRELARAIAGALAIAAAPDLDVEDDHTVPVEAVAMYLEALGKAGTRSGDAEAIRLLTRATELDPAFALAWARLAEFHADYAGDGWYGDRSFAEHFPLARAALERARRLDPNLLAAEDAALHIANAENDRAAALRAGRRMLQLNPNAVNTLNHAGAALRQRGYWDESSRLFERWTVVDPLNASAWMSLGDNLIALRRYSEAIPYYQRVSALDPKNGSLRLAWTQMCMNGDARPLYAHYRAYDPISYVAGSLAYRLGDYAEAHRITEEAYRRALADDPEVAEHIDWLAARYETLLAVGKQDEAKAIEAKLFGQIDDREEDPEAMAPWTRPWGYMNKAVTLFLKGDREGALARLAQAERAIPADDVASSTINARIGLAAALGAMGEHERALRLLQPALATPHRNWAATTCPWRIWWGWTVSRPFKDAFEEGRTNWLANPDLRALFREHGVDTEREGWSGPPPAP